jgi:hypothetical protein
VGRFAGAGEEHPENGSGPDEHPTSSCQATSLRFAASLYFPRGSGGRSDASGNSDSRSPRALRRRRGLHPYRCGHRRGPSGGSYLRNQQQEISRRSKASANAPSARRPNGGIFPAAKIDIISHALNNLLCVINANADILADQVGGSQHAVRSVDQIKKAAKNAAELMRQLKAL